MDWRVGMGSYWGMEVRQWRELLFRERAGIRDTRERL